MLTEKILRLIKKKLLEGYAANQIAAYLLVFLCPKELPPQIDLQGLTLQIEEIKKHLDREKSTNKQGNV